MDLQEIVVVNEGRQGEKVAMFQASPYAGGGMIGNPLVLPSNARS